MQRGPAFFHRSPLVTFPPVERPGVIFLTCRLADARRLAALTMVILSTLLTFASRADVSRYVLARDPEGAVRLADLVEIVLVELGSGVQIPDTAVESRISIPRSEAGTAVVLGLSVVLQRYGVALALTPTDLTVTLDGAALQRHIGALERWAMDAGGVETPYRVQRAAGSARGGPPVLLIHGLDSRAESLSDLATALVLHGYDVFTYGYPNDAAIHDTASDLARRLSRLHAQTGSPLSVVTTSMGGVITRSALELERVAPGAVGRFIACSPPFGGSPMARYHMLLEVPESVKDVFTEGLTGLFPFDGLGSASFQLLPGSSALSRFEGSRRQSGVRYAIFAGSGSIVPEALLLELRHVLFREREEVSPLWRVAIDLLLEVTDTIAVVSYGQGDGAVPLVSQALEGVTDRVVRGYDHLECFSTLGERRARESNTLAIRGSHPIAWLEELLARLPVAPLK